MRFMGFVTRWQSWRSLCFFALLVCGGAMASLPAIGCPKPVLARLERYEVRAGDTLESIAAAFNLVPGTLVRLNAALQDLDEGESLLVGTTILVPPFNGVRVEIPPGLTWQDLAAAYGVRADALFEINGCQPEPREIFVPGLRWQARDLATERRANYTGFAVQPLEGALMAIAPYGPSASGFHSGLDLAAAPGTPVRAVDAGEVAFAGQDETYGNLVVVNHAGRRQTRYAHLDRLEVSGGQTLAAGDAIGTTGMTGRPDSPQPHLHFEVRLQTPQGWIAQDPTLYLPQ